MSTYFTLISDIFYTYLVKENGLLDVIIAHIRFATILAYHTFEVF